MSHCFSDSGQLYPNTNVLKGSFVVFMIVFDKLYIKPSHSEKLAGADINKHTCRYFHPKKGSHFRLSRNACLSFVGESRGTQRESKQSCGQNANFTQKSPREIPGVMAVTQGPPVAPGSSNALIPTTFHRLQKIKCLTKSR